MGFTDASPAGEGIGYTLFVDVLRSPRVRSDVGQMEAVTPPSRTSNRPHLLVPDRIYEHNQEARQDSPLRVTTRRSRVIPIRERARPPDGRTVWTG